MVFRAAVVSYRTVGTTYLGGCCRFSPSCSDYALQALRCHRGFCAAGLILKRVFRCRPFGGSGFDPVPLVGEGSCYE